MIFNKKKNNEEITDLKTKLFSRGASLLSAGIKSSLKGAEFAINSAFKDKEKKKDLYTKFVVEQFTIFAKEMEQLKGGIMKAGQILSMFGEHLFPEEVNKILKKLQSDSKPVAFEVMEKAIQKRLGKERFKNLKFSHSFALIGASYALKSIL